VNLHSASVEYCNHNPNQNVISNLNIRLIKIAKYHQLLALKFKFRLCESSATCIHISPETFLAIVLQTTCGWANIPQKGGQPRTTTRVRRTTTLKDKQGWKLSGIKA